MSFGISDRFTAAIRRMIPPACVLCGDRAGDAGLCDGCTQSLPRLSPLHCPVCASPTPTPEVCGRCLDRPPRYDRVVAALTYTFPVDSLVTSLKYGRSLESARPLAAALTQALEREAYPDLVIAMPIAPERLAVRGFNQAAEIARLACREFGLSVSNDLVYRARRGVPQASLPWKERAKNVRGAFACACNLGGKSVAVVDDVITTGATLNELALVLKRAGARAVIGWIAARTLAES